MAIRYLFLCPDAKSASGGIAVFYDVVALLNRSGYDAAIVHNGPNAGYPDHPETVPVFYTRRLWRQYWRYSGPIDRLKMARERLAFGERRLQPIKLQPDDVIIAPEFQLAEVIEAFGDLPIAVFVQNPFSLMSSYWKATQRGLAPRKRVRFWLGIADVCRAHMSVLGLEPSAFFPVSMKPYEFSFRQEKLRLITYMPRKRPMEAALIVEALNRRGKLQGYKIEALDNIPRKEVASKLQQSRIFISLLHEEALGFPAAEAMAAGCIVVGFDGLGGAEYFDASVGIPVTEGDVASLIQSVERVVDEYEKDPARFDSMRQAASIRVNDRYSIAAFEAGALAAWKNLELVMGDGKR